MNRGPRIILPGVVALVVASGVWRLDFGPGIGPTPFITTVGVLFVVLGGVDATIAARFSSRPYGLLGMVLCGTFLVLFSAIYADLVLFSSRYSTPGLGMLVLNRLSSTLLLGSCGMGYVAARLKQHGESLLPPILGSLLLWVGSFGIQYVQGIATDGGLGFTVRVYILYLPAIIFVGVVIYRLSMGTASESQ